MGILDDTAIFAAVIQQGSFSRAAKYLNLSNGLVSRRIAQLESSLGTSLIKRTTRHFILTPEGEVFWQHAQRIQQELDAALAFIQTSANKPKGTIRISAPAYFGRHYLTEIIMKFLNQFDGIKINLILSNDRVDPIKDSSLHIKLLFKEKIKVYASPAYLQKQDEPKKASDLLNHTTIGYSNSHRLHDHEQWTYSYKNKTESITLIPKFHCNDIESSLTACVSGYGIGRFTDLNARGLLQKKLIQPILKNYDWGDYQLFVVYPHQKVLPKRSRLLLEFIYTYLQHFADNKESGLL